MHPDPTAPEALALTLLLAVVARAAATLTTGGAIAGLLVGAAVSVGLGLPGLAVLGTFFVAGSAATRVGWRRKTDLGTAEAGGGARDPRRVLGKGAVAAVAALGVALTAHDLRPAFAGAVAAALADTLGTEIGSLSRGDPVRLPSLRRAKPGTPGAVSLLGLGAGILGAALVGAVAAATGVLTPRAAAVAAVAGFAGSLLESAAAVVPAFPRLPGFVRNVFATGAGAVLAQAGAR